MKIGLALATAVVMAAAALSPAHAEQKQVTVWSWFVQSTMQKSIIAFEKTHPGIKVKYTYYNYSPEYITALKAAAASDSLPDLIGLQPGSLTQQYRSQLRSLNARAAKQWGAGWQDKIFPVNRKQMLMGNPAGDANDYILPQKSQDLVIWYNTKIFAKLGLWVPKSDGGVIAVAHALSKNGYIPMFQGAADGWQNENVFLMLANQRAPGLIDKAQAGQAKWTSPELVQAMTDWRALFTDGVFQQGALGAHTYPTGAQLFSQGRVGMMALGSWWMQESKFPPPLSQYVQNMDGFDFFYMPALKGSDHASPPVGGIDIGYGLTKNGAQNPAAWTFLASLINGAALHGAQRPQRPAGLRRPRAAGRCLGACEGNGRPLHGRPAEGREPALRDPRDCGRARQRARRRRRGSLQPEAALQSVQAATDKALAH